MIIELNFRLRNHETEPVPFDTPFIGMTPTITPVNASMLFGHKPRVFRLFLNAGFGPAEKDSYVVLTTQLVGDYEQDPDHYKMSLFEFRAQELLWCPRGDYELAVAQILKVLNIKHDHEIQREPAATSILKVFKVRSESEVKPLFPESMTEDDEEE